MNKWLALATCIAASVVVGCGSSKTTASGGKADAGTQTKNDGTAVVGQYTCKLTSEAEGQLQQDDAA